MGRFNYRVVKTMGVPEYYSEDGTDYAIHEVYYNDTGGICGMVEDPVKICAESIDGLKRQLKLLKLAFDKPVLDGDNMKYAPWDEEIDEFIDKEAEMLDTDELSD